MTAHHHILRVASQRAQSAALAATKHAAINRVADTIPDHEIDAALALLPDAAEKGARLDPNLHNGLFLLAEWAPGDRRATALYEAVSRKLDTIGIRSRFETVHKFFAELPYQLYVTFESLHEVANRETRRREAWLADVREAWLARAGAGAEVKVAAQTSTDSETVVLTAPEGSHVMPDPADRRPAALRVLEHRTPYDHDKHVSGVIAEAVSALRLPVWTFEAVAELWKAKSRGGDVLRNRGLWKGTAVRNVATLIFRGPASASGVEVTFAVDDIHDKSAAEVVEAALREYAAATFAAQEKPAAPPGPAVPVPPAQESAAPPAARARTVPKGVPFGSTPITLDVPFAEHERAAAEAKTAFPKSIAIPGGVVRVIKNPEEGVAYRIQTEIGGDVALSANATDDTDGAETLALFVEDAWKEAAAKQAAGEADGETLVEQVHVDPKPGKGGGTKPGAAKGTAAR